MGRTILGVFICGFLYFYMSNLHQLQEYERGVVFKFGKLDYTEGGGLHFVMPIIKKMKIIDTRLTTIDVPEQDVITKDNVSVKVDAVVYYKIIEPGKTITTVKNYHKAISKLSLTTMRSVCGADLLDDILINRKLINSKIQKILNEHALGWGIEVPIVELKHIYLPNEMKKAMASEAIEERKRRAKVIYGQGEKELSEILAKASISYKKNQIAYNLKQLQTMTEISDNKSKIIFFPYSNNFLKLIDGIGDN